MVLSDRKKAMEWIWACVIVLFITLTAAYVSIFNEGSKKAMETKERSRFEYPQNFSRNELIESEVADLKGIDNSPVNSMVEINLIKMANFLQDIRDCIESKTGVERPIYISSGYRTMALNDEVGGSEGSDHMRGIAADINVFGWTAYQTAGFITNHMCDFKFGQIINEHGKWVHISMQSAKHSGDIETAFVRVVNGEEEVFYEHGNFDPRSQ